MDSFAAWLELNKKLDDTVRRLESLDKRFAELTEKLSEIQPIAMFTPEQLKSLMQLFDGTIRSIAQDIKDEFEEKKRVPPLVN